MKLVPQSLSRAVGRQILVAQKNSPRLLFAAGLVGVVGGTVLACKATLKLGDTLDEIREDIEAVKAFRVSDPVIQADLAPVDHYNRDMAYVYAKGGVSIVRLYGPAVIVGGLSIAALTTSHVTLSRRNAALTAAYTAVSKAYDEYRERVRRIVGDERELEIYHAAELEDFKDPDTGKKIQELVSDPTKFSPYAKFFDESNVNWEKNPEENRLFIQLQQDYLNHLLRARGHVFLNEVYDALGIDRSQEGQVVGWVISDEGDNYIDFGMFQARNARFVNGYERSILLDFNVDGVIYDKI